jgi:predicted dehydrogenase/threonine dehydrogenase-like Zn-dependent dehydrogenase
VVPYHRRVVQLGDMRRMKQVLVKGGTVSVEEAPPPSCGPGMALVRVSHSLISSGTESSFVDSRGVAGYALKKARDPLNIEKVRRKLAAVGVRGTLDIVRNKLFEFQAPGYSSAGIIVACGPDAPGFSVGDRVACAGVGYASHAEYNAVPHALLTPLPENLGYDEAAFVALGAIALHGVRRAELTLGETVVVSGLGLVGQLAVQLARAAGARVIGCDPVAAKRDLALSLGAEAACEPVALDALVAGYTGELGADAVLVCAASSSSEVTAQALDVCRPRGRVVVVGAVGMQLPREPMYLKEIDFRLSCSYGPGRYQPDYEEHGVDYPVAYVRWTEGRNMAEFLRLVSAGTVQVKPLISMVKPIDQAAEAYAAVSAGDPNFVAALLDYTGGQPLDLTPPRSLMTLPTRGAAKTGVGVAVIGAGGFATGVHLPNLARIAGCRLEAVCARTGPKAKQAAERFGARLCATDYREVLADDRVDAVIVATRHAAHAEIALAALDAGKHVFVEKPLALTVKDCEAILERAAATGKLVSVGFNRRCSALALAARDALRAVAAPPCIHYRCNAGPLPATHWTRDPLEGGGRILGEAVHFFDLCCWLADSRPASISAERLAQQGVEKADDNLAVTLRMENGALANILYVTNGHAGMGKERIEAYAGGGALVIEDWKTLRFHGLRGKDIALSTEDKGQAALLENFIRAARGEAELAVTAEDGLWATRIALQSLAKACGC